MVRRTARTGTGEAHADRPKLDQKAECASWMLELLR